MADLSTVRSYRWVVILFIPLLIILIFLLSFYLTQQNTPPSDPIPVSPTGAVIHEDGIEENWPTDVFEFQGNANPSSLQDVQKVEDLPDGTKKYTATSANPARPIILIAKDNRSIYERSFPPSGATIPYQNFIRLYGQPDRVIAGPSFYGTSTSFEAIYAKKGVAVVVKRQEDQVVEYHYFRPTTVDDYLKHFGNDRSLQ